MCPKSVFNNRRKFILYTQDADIMPSGGRVAGTQGPAGSAFGGLRPPFVKLNKTT